MLCPKCKVEMNERIGDYHYAESGLDNVVLADITIYECPKCEGKAPSIANALGLHDHIAKELIEKKSLLTSREIRFLRKELGLKEVELASYLGVDKVTVSRWETGGSNIDPSYDRLLRLFFIHKKMGAATGALALFGKTIQKEPEINEIVIRSDLIQATVA